MGEEPRWIEQLIRVSKRRRVVLHWPSDITVREARKLRRSIGPLVDFIEALAQPEREDSPGHGGAGQTSDGKEGEDPADGREESVPGPVDGGSSPARDAVPPSTWLPPGAAPAEPLCERLPLVESPYERILLPAGGVRFRRTEEPIVKLLREVGREIDEKLDDEDPGYFERVRARLFGGGGT